MVVKYRLDGGGGGGGGGGLVMLFYTFIEKKLN